MERSVPWALYGALRTGLGQFRSSELLENHIFNLITLIDAEQHDTLKKRANFG